MEMSGEVPNLGPSGHVDDFTRRNLPPFQQWPELRLDRPEFSYPEYLNAAVELTDRIVEKGSAIMFALIGNGRQRTYKELADWSEPPCACIGRELRREARQPGTDPLRQQSGVGRSNGLRRQRPAPSSSTPCRCCVPAKLAQIIDKAEIALALTDSRIADELVACRQDQPVSQAGREFRRHLEP